MEKTKCSKKIAFITKNEAKASAVVAQFRYGNKLKVYKCKDCELWHLASNYE